jgi:leucyl-tRNA synthetase
MAEDLLGRTLSDVEEIIRVTGRKPARITLFTPPAWKRAGLKAALEEKEAPKYAQRLMKGAHALNSDPLQIDEFATLSQERKYLERAFGCPVNVLSADEPGDDPMKKSRNAEPGRPAIFIE